MPGASPRLQLWLDLPARGDGPSRVCLRVDGGSSVAALRERAAAILGAPSLDAYLSIDGRRINNEEVPVSGVAVSGSRVTVHPRLRGGMMGAGSSADGGLPPSLPAPPVGGSGAVCPAFPPMVFDDPVGTRTPAQLTAFAETTRTYIDMIVTALGDLQGKVGGLESSFRGDTESIRRQSGTIFTGMQQRAEEIIGKMLRDQDDARSRLEIVVASAEAKFQEVDHLISATHIGLGEVAGAAAQLGDQ